MVWRLRCSTTSTSRRATEALRRRRARQWHGSNQKWRRRGFRTNLSRRRRLAGFRPGKRNPSLLFVLQPGHSALSRRRDTRTFRRRRRNRNKQAIWMCYITLDPSNPNRVFTGSFRVWRSDDDAENWRAVSPKLDGSSITAIEVAPANSRLCLCGHGKWRLFSQSEWWHEMESKYFQFDHSGPHDYQTRESSDGCKNRDRDSGELWALACLSHAAMPVGPGKTSTKGNCRTCRIMSPSSARTIRKRSTSVMTRVFLCWRRTARGCNLTQESAECDDR